MKILNGAEIAGFIKERHAKQVRALRADKIFPKLAIVQTKNDPIINTYVQLKKQYGSDIGVEVELYKVEQIEVPKILNKLSIDESVHGIIVQLPLEDPSQTDEIVNLVASEKDVDALGNNSKFEPATPMAILWLLSGYNVELTGRKILLIGRGKLVGAPLEKILRNSGYNVEIIGRKVPDLANRTKEADVIITATGSPAILYPDMIKQGAVMVDAGVASEEGKTVGDLAPEIYQRDDLTLTPKKGGVGPLTVCALFENVIRAAQNAKK
ncbi:bifunctional 5,10-methylenetetrahydrofolate dehydrogenase/5,10-methenyltetrahydrofolate cyclohydrolase [Candidatus Saccharibacteria bacterium]|nr:bifunctional 5,10-methylenetetrahydrofolate dehydrogenase/5,10-methenyltetrahydrofolate cyclohydrolase [Candidatus Saccharibacteria bacterium]